MVYEEGGELGPFLICVVYFSSVFSRFYILLRPRGGWSLMDDE